MTLKSIWDRFTAHNMPITCPQAHWALTGNLHGPDRVYRLAPLCAPYSSAPRYGLSPFMSIGLYGLNS
jgi:hypothetical protein